MSKPHKRLELIWVLVCLTYALPIVGQSKSTIHISGTLHIDETWNRTVYLSHIPSFDEMYHMSNEMIIAETELDSFGHFKMNLDFLPYADHLYRLHMVKEENAPATLIIGGIEENHTFLILNRSSEIRLVGNEEMPPFKDIMVANSSKNTVLQAMRDMLMETDRIGSKSSASKRQLLEKRTQADLLTIADTSSNFLVSQYALHQSNTPSEQHQELESYTSLKKKWSNMESSNYYVLATNESKSNTSRPIYLILSAILIFAFGFLFGKKKDIKSNKRLAKLSVQERKVYELISSGMSNQEIADKLNIGLSTVKSHITSIYSKLKVKSRKEIINTK